MVIVVFFKMVSKVDFSLFSKHKDGFSQLFSSTYNRKKYWDRKKNDFIKTFNFLTNLLVLGPKMRSQNAFIQNYITIRISVHC